MEFSEDEIEAGKLPAIASYLSLLTGWPLFLWPLATRDNAYALQHGKWAGALYVYYWITAFALIGFSVITCGFGSLFIFLLFLWWIPAAMGVMGVLNGKAEPPPLAEGMANKLFSSIELKIEG